MAKTKAFGSIVTIGGVAIGGITGINLPEEDISYVEVTTMDSPNREFVPGLSDPGVGTISGKIDFADAGQDALRAAANTISAFVVTLPNGKTISFSAIPNGMGAALEMEGSVDFSVSLRLTTAKTFAA